MVSFLSATSSTATRSRRPAGQKSKSQRRAVHLRKSKLREILSDALITRHSPKRRPEPKVDRKNVTRKLRTKHQPSLRTSTTLMADPCLWTKILRTQLLSRTRLKSLQRMISKLIGSKSRNLSAKSSPSSSLSTQEWSKMEVNLHSVSFAFRRTSSTSCVKRL